AMGPLDAGDLELALNYLRDFRTVVVTEPVDGDAAEVIARAAGWSDASIVVVTRGGAAVPGAFDDATVLEAPPDDPDAAFAGLVGRFAAALDSGADTESAFRSASTTAGWERSND